MEFEATLNTLSATVATFSIPTAAKLKDASVPASAVVTVTADSGTFPAGPWVAGAQYIVKIERSGV